MPQTGFDPAVEAGLYAGSSLLDVLPSVAASLGADLGLRSGTRLPLPAADSAVVVLVDGLGHELLHRRRGHTPFLRGLLPSVTRLHSGFPSTTATSMGCFGTAQPPGVHGLLGYEVLVPERGVLLNELTWKTHPELAGPAIDPWQWQPHPTVFERLAGTGVLPAFVGPAKFDGSGLTLAALRGAPFHSAERLAERVDAALALARGRGHTLTYLYWGLLDGIGHQYGCESYQWGDELAHVDREVSRLVAGAPRGCRVYLTADHGMVDSPRTSQIDLADHPRLRESIRFVGGEPRLRQLYVTDGATNSVAARWREALDGRALVWTRDDVVARGLLGTPVLDEAALRCGDVVVAMLGDHTVVDSSWMTPSGLAMVGQHGSLTSAEVGIPFVELTS